MKNNLNFGLLKELYSYETLVRIGDINYGNHLAHDKLVTILHDARVTFLKEHSLSELKISDNIGIMLTDLNIIYKKEAFWGDRLIVKVYNGDISSTSFDINYKVENNHKQEIATCTTKMVCVDITKRKLTKIPQNLMSILIN